MKNEDYFIIEDGDRYIPLKLLFISLLILK